MRSTKFLRGMILSFVLTTAVSFGVAASDVSTMWETIYKQSPTEAMRYDVMLKMVEVNDPDLTPVMLTALQQLMTRRIEAGTAQDQRTKINLAQLIVTKLGNSGANDAKSTIMQVYRESKDPYLFGEAALALARLGATEYIDFFVRSLSDINLKPDVGRTKDQEVQATYLVAALQILKQPQGLDPVFNASIGWYSPASKVRDQAKTAFMSMSDNPLPFLLTVVQKNPSITAKLRALDATELSSQPASAKTDIARAALDAGIQNQGKDLLAKQDLSTLRLRAVRLLNAASDSSPDSVTLIAKNIKLVGATSDEIILDYETLGKNTSPDSSAFLIAQLTEYNRRQKEGVKNTDDERKYIRSIIAALGVLKPSSAKTVLTDAQFSNHDSEIAREAKAVADSLK